MHAILIAIGSAGDVFPFIGLARTLKLRGHRVSLCTIPVSTRWPSATPEPLTCEDPAWPGFAVA